VTISEKKLEEIRNKFVDILREWKDDFVPFSKSLNMSVYESEKIDEIAGKLHKIAGSARVFNYRQLELLCRQAENELMNLKADEPIKFLTDTFGKILDELEAIFKNEKADKKLKVEPSLKRLSKRYNVMVVDDDPITNEIVCSLLEEIGCNFVSCKDGIETLERIEEITPDLIILDINMPRMDGLETLKEIKKHRNTQGISIIMLTRRDTEEDFIHSVAAGAIDYVKKPFELSSLANIVTSTLESRKTRILIIDEDKSNLEHLKNILQRRGMTVFTSEHIDESRIENNLDVIIANSNQVYKLQKLDIPVVALMDSNVNPEELKDLFSKGFTEHITKPIDTEFLVSIITKVKK
jgi:CheY-like chemotaxis protein/HPt (histidine-containing phosphotransfer) domain-containing protein